MFFILFRSGMLKNKQTYACHYYIKNLISKGDVVIDIGANFGYYSVLFSDLVDEQGKVFAVEPVDLYRSILKRNIGKRKNVEIMPYALGENDGATVEMGIPGSDISRHGLTHVITDKRESHKKTFSAEMRNPAHLFSALERLDYIKCDVEGFEIHIIPLLLPLIAKFHPKLQIETSGENKRIIQQLMLPLGYHEFHVMDDQLVRLSENEPHTGDLFFIYPSKR